MSSRWTAVFERSGVPDHGGRIVRGRYVRAAVAALGGPAGLGAAPGRALLARAG
ncbi:hypothetical protein ACFWIN_01265 [Streptomyces sp. NPDC127049]|uniref:hypothetical protein n=1 Tax=Streptomyces sp. NPDC127049 TaxID=3347118 RepID=UPI0036618BA6